MAAGVTVVFAPLAFVSIPIGLLASLAVAVAVARRVAAVSGSETKMNLPRPARPT